MCLRYGSCYSWHKQISLLNTNYSINLQIFDPNLKKKKKKKTGFNLDAALAEGSGAPEPAPTPENGEVQEAKESTPEMDGMLNDSVNDINSMQSAL